MSDQITTDATDAAALTIEENPEALAADTSGMGTFDAEGKYIPRQVTENDLGAESLDDAYTASMVQVEDGQIVEGA